MKNRLAWLAAALVLGLGWLSPTPLRAASSKADDLRAGMRELWNGHIFWIRSVAVATADHNRAAAKVADAQVVANARAIGDAVGGVYGKAAGDQLFGLLAGHYGAVKAYLNATIPRVHKAAQERAAKTLNANAVEIADFLSKANPYLPKDTLVSLLQTHGSHHLAQINALADHDYEGEAAICGMMTAHINAIADALAGAIVKQFPDKF